MDLDFRNKLNNIVASVRATALIIKDEKIFLTKYSNNRYYPLGGAVKIGETTESAVSRETKEEVGIDVVIDRLAFIVENYFFEEDVSWHNIEFHYIVSPKEEPDLKMQEGSKVQVCEWVEINKLDEIDLVPEFLKTELPNWNGQLKHVINK